MLGSVMVILQRQTRARVHHDALDLEACAFIDALEIPPGAVHPPVRGVLGSLLSLQRLDHFFHALRCVLLGDQHSVRSLHNDEIIHAHCRDQAMLRAHITSVHAFK